MTRIKKYILLIFIIINSLGSFAQGIYFDSLYYAGPNEPVSVLAQIYATDSGYTAIGLHGPISHSFLEKIDLSLTGEMQSVQSWAWPDPTVVIYWYGDAFYPTQDGGYLWGNVFSGPTTSIIKFDENLDTLFTINYPAVGDQSKQQYYFYETETEYIGTCVITTDSDTEYYGDLELIRLDHNGQILAQDTIEMFNQEYQLSLSGIHQLESGGFLVSGARLFDWDPFIAKFNEQGELLDTFVWGTEYNDWLPWLVPVEDGNYMVSYSRVDYEIGGYPVARPGLMKFNSNTMDSLWTTGAADSMYLYLDLSFTKTIDGGYASAGFHTYGTQLAHIQKWSADGEPEWSRSYRHVPSLGDTINDNQAFWDIAATPDSGLIVCGYYYNNSNQHAWVLKLDNCGDPVYDSCVVVIENTIDIGEWPPAKAEIYAWPNPFDEVLNLQLPDRASEIEIIDAMGQVVQRKKVWQLIHRFDLSELPTGAYIVRARMSNGEVLSKRVIKSGGN
jgi:Secretion system C-terminal sorting domain